MLSHRRRSRRSRLLVPFGIGVVIFIGIGSVVAGKGGDPGPGPVGGVAGATHAASDAPSTDLGSTPAETAGETPRESVAESDGGREGATPAPPTLPDARDVPAPVAPPLEDLTGYRWPLAKARLTLPYGPTPWGSRIVDGEKFHDGLDLATFCGDRVVAAHDGVVLAAGRRYDDQMGWIGDLSKYYARLDAKKLWTTLPIVVVIDDGNGYRSVYAHFGKIVVKKGQTVEAGELLGFEGRTGRASGCHLHYGLFSPYETASFGMEPVSGKHMKLPTALIARVDPRLVLPERTKAKPKAAPSAIPAP